MTWVPVDHSTLRLIKLIISEVLSHLFQMVIQYLKNMFFDMLFLFSSIEKRFLLFFLNVAF